MSEIAVRVIVLTHLAATLFMVGLIWFVQVVHYPLFARVGTAESAEYERNHTRRTGWVVAPPMLAELVTAVLLTWVRPASVPLGIAVAGLALLATIWVSTWAIQIPCHERLSRAFDAATHRRLVATNWFRTWAWTLRGILALSMVSDALP